jgi:cobyrinic acid a,c-diamide synthase
MALLKREGYVVQPFKCGPDYIDTKFHEAVCGRPSVNLDTFMATPEHVRNLFAHYSADAGVCIVEGMMGLFDGYDRDSGSSAEIARVLNLPVVLVVDARSAAYSMAALLQGFIHFRNDVHIVGVIFNRVGSQRHFQLLQQVCSDLHVACLGYLPKNVQFEQGSRYLGLDFSEQLDSNPLVEQLAACVDWHQLLKLSAYSLTTSHVANDNRWPPRKKLSALVARNAESFSFLYQETLDGFQKVRFFDPETEVPDFEGMDLLYLPGGYPEKHLPALVGNEACRRAVKDYAERGGKVQAECGGMMYLCQSIVDDLGEHPMCGVLPYKITARKQDRHLSLGYRRFELDGREYRGHEFHYSQFLVDNPASTSVLNPLQHSVTQVYDAKGNPVETPVFRYRNVFASYTHLYL